MKRISFHFKGLKPISLNNYQKIAIIRGRPVKFKTDAFKKFYNQVYKQLVFDQAKTIKDFNSYYDKKKHYLSAIYKFYYPVYTAKNEISMKSNDIDNLIKPINDIIFSKLNSDDSQIMKMFCEKIHSDDLKIEITYFIKERHGF